MLLTENTYIILELPFLKFYFSRMIHGVESTNSSFAITYTFYVNREKLEI